MYRNYKNEKWVDNHKLNGKVQNVIVTEGKMEMNANKIKPSKMRKRKKEDRVK